MSELQVRVVRGILSLVATHQSERIVIVTHAEPIRAAILHYRQIPLNEFARIQVDPGSLTTLQFRDDDCTIIGENDRGAGQAVAA